MSARNIANDADRVEARHVIESGEAIRLPLKIYQGHLIVKLDGRRALVDIGCQVAGHRDSVWSVAVNG